MKSYKTERGAKIAAGKIGGRVVRRDRFGRFSKRGKHWSVIGPPRKRKPPVKLPNEWQIKIDYSKSKGPRGKRPILIDAVIRSSKPLSRNEAETVFRNAVNGIKPGEGISIDAIKWNHGGKPQPGSTSDLGRFNTLINGDIDFRVERKD